MKILLIAAILALCGCARVEEETLATDWRQIAAGAFVMSAPPTISRLPVQGVDSLVGRYGDSNFLIDFDYGPYSDPLDYRTAPEYSRRRVTIDGLDGAMISCLHPDPGSSLPYLVAIHFSNTYAPKLKLTVRVGYRNKNDSKRAEAILRSIVFTPEPP